MHNKRIKGNSRAIAALLFLFLALHWTCSEDSTANFPEVEPDPELVPLPQVIINSTETIVDEPKVRATMKIIDNGKVDYDGIAGIEIRGASSQMFDKKSYGLETWDDNNEDLEVSLMGMPEEEDWILYGPYSDKSLMRNILIYDLSRGMERYASRCAFVELTLNGEFKGVYVFMEKLKRDSGRIDIEKLKKDENTGEDLTGGYILKIDKTAGNNLGEGYNELNSFTSRVKPLHMGGDQEIRFLYEEPDAEDITSEQKAYISSYVHEFEEVLASDGFTDPETGYRAYIDVPSFIDFFILNEISLNVDAYRLSTFIQKDMSGKLQMGPIWDFNLAFGNANYCGGSDTNSWAYRFNERCPDDYWAVPFWWYRLLEDPAFVAELKDRYNALRGGVLSNAAILGRMDGYVKLLEDAGAIERNFKTWDILGTYIWPNNFVGATYASERAYMENWIKDRLQWMDGAINGL